MEILFVNLPGDTVIVQRIDNDEKYYAVAIFRKRSNSEVILFPDEQSARVYFDLHTKVMC